MKRLRCRILGHRWAFYLVSEQAWVDKCERCGALDCQGSPLSVVGLLQRESNRMLSEQIEVARELRELLP